MPFESMVVVGVVISGFMVFGITLSSVWYYTMRPGSRG
jgi:hypothetical protein